MMHRLTVFAYVLLAVMASTASEAVDATAPKTVLWDANHLRKMRSRAPALSVEQQEALARLQAEAEQAARRGPYSVMDKSALPPSGDKHDYMSFSRYWWPNPKTTDGLPYVQRDGRVNHELLRRGDRLRIGAFFDDLETLALAYYLLDNPEYASHAASLLTTWFLDPNTRMNPHLNYAQAVPGRAVGRDVGIIDTRYFYRVLDAAALLETSQAWSRADAEQLREWFREFLSWLQTSPLGKEEQEAQNNHGTWYDVQCARIALFVDDTKLARDILTAAQKRRIEEAIEADGRQPHELARTRSLHYSLFNLTALGILARMGESAGVELWSYEGSDGASIRCGLGYVLPYLVNPTLWPHEQIAPVKITPNTALLFWLAAKRFDNHTLMNVYRTLPAKDSRRDFNPLLFPAVQEEISR